MLEDSPQKKVKLNENALNSLKNVQPFIYNTAHNSSFWYRQNKGYWKI